MTTLRYQLGIKEQQIEAMECAYKALYDVARTEDAIPLALRDNAKHAMNKLYDVLNGIAETAH